MVVTNSARRNTIADQPLLQVSLEVEPELPAKLNMVVMTDMPGLPGVTS